jgi:hypothetical protein
MEAPDDAFMERLMERQMSRRPWCPGCRLWTDDWHFLTDGTSLCGHRLVDLRHHLVSPRRGDVWQTTLRSSHGINPKVLLMVDYVHDNDIRVVTECRHVIRIESIRNYLRFIRGVRKSQLIQAAEDDDQMAGFTTKEPRFRKSLEYLRRLRNRI